MGKKKDDRRKGQRGAALTSGKLGEEGGWDNRKKV